MVLGTMPYSSISRSSKKAPIRVVMIIYFAVLLPLCLWAVLFLSGRVTLAGVPAPILIEFLSDEKARNAYFAGDGTTVHNRLSELGIEEEIKAFYRPQIQDEAKLDQYIHQILYDRTGYIGKAYRVNQQGVLVLKKR